MAPWFDNNKDAADFEAARNGSPFANKYSYGGRLGEEQRKQDEINNAETARRAGEDIADLYIRWTSRGERKAAEKKAREQARLDAEWAAGREERNARIRLESQERTEAKERERRRIYAHFYAPAPVNTPAPVKAPTPVNTPAPVNASARIPVTPDTSDKNWGITRPLIGLACVGAVAWGAYSFLTKGQETPTTEKQVMLAYSQLEQKMIIDAFALKRICTGSECNSNVSVEWIAAGSACTQAPCTPNTIEVRRIGSAVHERIGLAGLERKEDVGQRLYAAGVRYEIRELSSPDNVLIFDYLATYRGIPHTPQTARPININFGLTGGNNPRFDSNRFLLPNPTTIASCKNSPKSIMTPLASNNVNGFSATGIEAIFKTTAELIGKNGSVATFCGAAPQNGFRAITIDAQVPLRPVASSSNGPFSWLLKLASGQ